MRGVGIVVALGFLLASAFMNFQYGFSLGRTVHEGWAYGLVGVLAVASNGLCPFLLTWHVKRRALQGAILLLWVFCLTYSLTSAIGFAAENRDGRVAGRESAKANYEMTLASLADLESKRDRLKTRRYDDRIEALREDAKRQAAAGANLEADPQALVLATLISLDPKNVRLGVQVIFGVMVELGAALLLFASVGGEAVKAKAPVKAPMWRPKWQR